jgi:AAA family ATP:ADP antiporter
LLSSTQALARLDVTRDRPVDSPFSKGAGVSVRTNRRDQVLEALLQIRPSELALTALLFAHGFAIVGAMTLGRSLRDALFLARFDRSALPWMYIAQAMVVGGLSAIYARHADRVRKDRMATWTALILAAGLLAFRPALALGSRAVVAGLYVWVELLASVAIIQFWSLASELFDPREAKRLFGLIGAGGTTATILLGPLMVPFARRLGTEALLFPCAALMIGAAWIARSTGRRCAARLAMRVASAGPRARGFGLARIGASGHLRLVALLGAATFITTTLVDYQFKAIAQARYSQDQLTAFFGVFYGVCGVLSLLIQLGGTGRLLARYGVVVALVLLPLGLAMGTGVLIAVPVALWAATWAKGADNVVRYTINDATTQLLYLPVPAQLRGAAKATIDGVFKPASIALAGLLLLAARQAGLGARSIAVATLVLIGLWLLGLAKLRGQYVRSLQETLRRRRLDLSAAPSLAEGEATEVILHAFASSDPQEVLNAIELLPSLSTLQLDGGAEGLLDHPDGRVRQAILEHLARHPTPALALRITRALEDPAAGVRAAAVTACCAIQREDAVSLVQRFLGDGEPEVRAAAIVGMIQHGGLDGVLGAAEALKALITHPDVRMRAHAAKVLGALGAKSFHAPLQQLLGDVALPVRLEAIAAAGKLATLELAPRLVELLARAETSAPAAAALAAQGDCVLPLLEQALRAEAEPHLRRSVPRVLSALRTPAAAALLVAHLDDADPRLRTELAQAIRRAARKDRGLPLDVARIQAALHRELARAFSTLALAEALGLELLPGPGCPRQGIEAARAMLHGALLEKVAAAEHRIFALLAPLYPEAGIELVWAGIRDAHARDAARLRANAVELLDNVLPRELKQRLVPLLEQAPRSVRLRLAEHHFPQPLRSADRALLELLEDESPWVRACACMLVKERGLEAARDGLVLNLRSPWSVLREAALCAIAALGGPDLPALLEQARADPCPQIRSRAEALRPGSTPQTA